ncbi:MAG: ABC transporter ATP-binding protein, partial [Acidimicrobiales bacterium]|nr:ABC transporter ATP-binding protein [Acidimicrobiales bacterium]
EAMTLGDRVALLRRGELQQVAAPRALYEEPVNMFVAGFIGSPPMNFLPAVVEGGELRLPVVGFRPPDDVLARVGDRSRVMVGLRPERFTTVTGDGAGPDDVEFEAEVDVVEWLGNEQYAYLPYDEPEGADTTLEELERDLDSERLRSQLVVALDPADAIASGDRIRLRFDPRSMHVFDVETGENLTLGVG